MGDIPGVVEDSVAYRPRAQWLAHGSSSSLSLRTYMVGLILAVVIPLLAFSTFLVLRSAEHEQEIMGSVVRDRTAAAAAMIDHELSLLRSRLFLLASSRHLQTGDFAAFHAEASKQDGVRKSP